MNIVIEQANSYVLPISILKAHLRIDHDHEDGYLKTIINMATDILEKNIERPILKKKFKYTDYTNEISPTRKVILPIRQVIKVYSVKRINEKAKEDIEYRVDSCNDKTIIITNGYKDPIEVIYTAGITDKQFEVSCDLQFAVLQIAKNIYECSDEDVLESKYVKHIIHSHRPLTLH